jgi:peptidoglycan hydrolase FlgJ
MMPGPITPFAPMPLPEAKVSPANARKAKLEQACQDFESLFIHQMLEQMRKTVPQGGMFSGGKAEALYTSMLDGEVAKSVSHHRGMGLASVLYRQLITQIDADGSEEL